MYIVKKATHTILSPFDEAWEKADVAPIDKVNWEGFSAPHSACAKMLYSEYGIHVRMETDERPLKAVQTVQNSAVCEDSCMEFFFCGNENDKRYMNFEFNPFGTMYLNFRTGRNDGCPPTENADYFNVYSVITPKKWILFFTVPFEFLTKYYGGYSKTMYGNFYKCGNKENTEHYLSHCPIRSEKPDFHRPEFFGKIILD